MADKKSKRHFRNTTTPKVPSSLPYTGISGIQTSVYAWSSDGEQIDLVIDRKDQVINLFEMKFSIRPFAIDKKYAAELRHKIGRFKEVTGSNKAIFLSFLSTFGLAKNEYAGLVQNDLGMEVLFE